LFYFLQTYSSDVYFQESNWNAIEELAFLYALEEWLCEHSDKYIDPFNSGNCITDWDSVAQHIRSKNVNGKLRCIFITTVCNIYYKLKC